MSIKSRGIILPRKHKKCDHPKVSVIVPVYKVDRYLTQCLNSIVNQTMEELEIIIVDEGDMDRCREIIDVFEKNDPRIMAPHKKNGGYGASVNLGMRMAKGEYIAIVESDDWIEPEMYEEMYAYAKSLDADITKAPFFEYFSDGYEREYFRNKLLNESLPENACFDIKEFGLLMGVHPCIWSALYKTEFMRSNGIEFPTVFPSAYIDLVFRVDILTKAEKIAWIAKPYYHYRVDSVGSTVNNYNMRAAVLRWKEIFSSINIEEYNNHYGKFLVSEEYINLILHAKELGISRESYEGLIDDFKNVSESVANDAYAIGFIPKRWKDDIVELKRNPKKFYYKIKLISSVFKIKNLYGKKLKECLDILSNPVLLFWLFVGTISSSVFAITTKLVISDSAYGAFISEKLLFLSLPFVAGLFACFMGKMVRKCCIAFVRGMYS